MSLTRISNFTMRQGRDHMYHFVCAHEGSHLGSYFNANTGKKEYTRVCFPFVNHCVTAQRRDIAEP